MSQGQGGGKKPIVLDDEQIVQVEALAAYLTVDQIADYLGITRITFYEIMKRQPEVGLRYKSGKSKAITNIAKNLTSQARDGSTAAAIFYLKTQAGWKETSVTEHTGDMTINSITRTIIDPKSD